MALKISSGKIPRAQKVVLYGVEGIGKTTLAAQTPGVLFIDTEGGTAHMDVNRLDGITTWEQLKATVNEVALYPDVCQTLAIDTADWAEQAMIKYVLKKRELDSIEDAGYGKGYTYLGEEFSELLKACDRVIAAGINVVITAHAKMRKQELPDEMGAFDRWELKLSKQCAPLLKEWADAVLFCNYKTIVVTTENKTKKGQGGKRVIYTVHRPAFDAKNRHNLPEEMDMTYANIAPIFNIKPASESKPEPPAADKSTPITEATLKGIMEMLEKEGIKPEEVQGVVAKKKKYPAETPIAEYSEEFAKGWLKKNWGNIMKTILDDPNHVPF